MISEKSTFHVWGIVQNKQNHFCSMNVIVHLLDELSSLREKNYPLIFMSPVPDS